MNSLHTLIILSFALNFSLSGFELCKKICRKRPNECLQAEDFEQSKKARFGLSEQDKKERNNRLLEKLKAPCTSKQWSSKRLEILSALKQGVHPDDISLELHDSRTGQTQREPLVYAVQNNDLSIALSLLKHNANPNQDNAGHSVLYEAQTPAMVQLLLAYKADAQEALHDNKSLFFLRQPSYGYRPGHEYPTPETILLFFRAGAPVNKISTWMNHSVLLEYLTHSVSDLKVYSLLVKLGCPLDVKAQRSMFQNKDFLKTLEEMESPSNPYRSCFRGVRDAFLQARQEMQLAGKERQEGLGPYLTQQLRIPKVLSSIIIAYVAGDHVLPLSVCKALDQNEEQYPLDVDKLPDYDKTSCFQRLLGY